MVASCHPRLLKIYKKSYCESLERSWARSWSLEVTPLTLCLLIVGKMTIPSPQKLIVRYLATSCQYQLEPSPFFSSHRVLPSSHPYMPRKRPSTPLRVKCPLDLGEYDDLGSRYDSVLTTSSDTRHLNCMVVLHLAGPSQCPCR